MCPKGSMAQPDIGLIPYNKYIQNNSFHPKTYTTVLVTWGPFLWFFGCQTVTLKTQWTSRSTTQQYVWTTTELQTQRGIFDWNTVSFSIFWDCNISFFWDHIASLKTNSYSSLHLNQDFFQSIDAPQSSDPAWHNNECLPHHSSPILLLQSPTGRWLTVCKISQPRVISVHLRVACTFINNSIRNSQRRVHNKVLGATVTG